MEESDATPSSHSRNTNSKEPPSLPGCKDDEAEDDEGVNSGCGWFRFRPKILAPFAHVWTFIILYIVFSFTHAVQGSYPIAVLTTLERRFNLSSFLAGVVVNISVLGYIVSIIIFSIFLTKTHKPRLFAFCMLVTATGAFLYFLPHLAIRTGNDAISLAHAQTPYNTTLSSESGSGAIQVCGEKSGVDGSSTSEVDRRSCSAMDKETAFEDVSHVVPAVIMLCMADLVHGISAASIWTVGLVFIDDHTAPQLSAKLIGLMYTVRLISPIVSFAMGGYFLSIHNTLKETDLTPKHPQWIGAWWMGFLINAIINFIIFIPMSMLPRNLRPIRKSSSNADSPENGKIRMEEEVEQKESGKKEGNGKEEEHGKEKEEHGKIEGSGKELENERIEECGKRKEDDDEQSMKKTKEEEDGSIGDKYQREEDETEMEEEKEKDEDKENKENGKTEEEDKKISIVSVESASGTMKSTDASQIDWKEFPRAMIRLITNPIYVLTVIAICSDWSILSFMSFMPKYFEVHFQKTASVANLLGGMIPATFAAAASYVGGVVAGKIKGMDGGGKVKGMDGGVTGLCRMNFSASLLSVLLLVPALLLSCPNISHSGQLVNQRLNVTTDCNVNCGCSSDIFDPVCGSDGLLYFSPCHAGCTQLVNSTALLPNDIQGRLVRSEECRCVAESDESDEDGGREGGALGGGGGLVGGDGGGGGGVVFAGFCDDGCQSLIPYVLSLIAFVVAFCMHNSSATTVLLRCIKKEDKSFALGLETLCICFAIFPAPLLYGKVFDASCILKRTSSCTESEGTCLLYDRHSLRLTFHGLTIGLKVISTTLFCATYFFGRRNLSQLTAQQKMVDTAELNELNTNAIDRKR